MKIKPLRKPVSLSAVLVPALSFIASVVLFLAAKSEPSTKITSLRVAHNILPLAVEDRQPVFNWQMESELNGQKQSACQIVVKRESDGKIFRDNGKGSGGLSHGIRYAGNPLEPETDYKWSSTVWDAKGRKYKTSSGFETGLMNPDIKAWAGAMCMVPWQLYTQYRYIQTVQKNMPAMKARLEGMARFPFSNQYPNLSVRTTGLADWVAVGRNTPSDLINNAIYIYLMEVTAIMADAVGDRQYAGMLSQRHTLAKEEWNKCYVDPATGKTRTSKGATSVWERWNGYEMAFRNGGDKSMNSFNHFALGAAGQWMYEFQLGITTDHGNGEAGYKHFMLQPSAGQGFTSLKGSFNSIYGRNSSNWTADGKGSMTSYRAKIHANTSDTHYPPVSENAVEFLQVKGARFTGTCRRNNINVVIYELESGSYKFDITDNRVNMITL